MITVKGKELDFNFMNADHVQKWENARKDVAEKYKDISEADSSKMDLQAYANLLRRACASIFELFDGIFGEGTSNTLFGGECDFEACIDAYAELEAAIAEQAKSFSNKAKRYMPAGVKGK